MNSVIRRLLPIVLLLPMCGIGLRLHAADTGSPSVTELTVEQATEFASLDGDLELNHLSTLTPQVAENYSPSPTVRSSSTA